MEYNSKNTGFFLFLGVFLMLATMILHPAPSNFHAIAHHPQMGIISHSLAVLSVPFSALGFFGLAMILKEINFFSKLGLAIILLGLLSAMLAATLNGLALPIFVMNYQDATDEVIKSLEPIFRYNMALNHAFDYIMLASIIISTLLFSIAILRTKIFPAFIGWLGSVISTLAFVSWIFGFYFLDLAGLRIFIFGWVIWIGFISWSCRSLHKRSAN